jgi:RNase P subunit RPR2
MDHTVTDQAQGKINNYIYCIRCKRVTETMGDMVVMSNNKAMLVGTCANCGQHKRKYIKKDR